MFELLIVILGIGLCFKSLGLALRLTGGVIRVLMALVSIILMPVLLIGTILIGGIMILIPLGTLLFVVWLGKCMLE